MPNLMRMLGRYFRPIVVLGIALVIVGVFLKKPDGSASSASTSTTTSAFDARIDPIEIRLPTPPPPPKLRLACQFDGGTFISHDLTLTNASGLDLTEVHLSIEFVGEDASPTVERYWADWRLGVRQRIHESVDHVKNVQRIKVGGTASEGVFSQEFDVSK